jgi:hypothetical protein
MVVQPLNPFLLRFWPLQPWPVLMTGVGVVLVGLALMVFGAPLGGARFVCFLVGLITVGAAVSMRLRKAGQAFEERTESAGVLAVAAFAALLAFLGTDKSWDSLQMVLVVLVLVALGGVVLVLLPTPARMIVVGALVILHFVGILTAATTIEPPGSVAPWVSQELWADFYHPYLQFMYLGNAYHFYSPDPGPPSLLWFHIRYQDGRVKWFKIPHRDDDPLPVHHTRLLSITESTSELYLVPPEDFTSMRTLQQDRRAWGEKYEIPVERQNYILPVNQQYQEPQPFALKMLSSYVRHVAHTFPTLGAADNTVRSIKVYRFRQTFISQEAMALGRSPLDKSLFVGYYQGEYDKDGTLLYQNVYDAAHKLVECRDPFRYWYIPIYYERINGQPFTPDVKIEEERLVDCLVRHAELDMSVDPPVVRDGPNDPADSPWDDDDKPPSK